MLDTTDFAPDVLLGDALESQTLGLTFLHELIHFGVPFGEMNAFDDPDCDSMPPPSRNATGPVVDQMNVIQRGDNLPTRDGYCPTGEIRKGRKYWMTRFSGGRFLLIDIEKSERL